MVATSLVMVDISAPVFERQPRALGGIDVVLRAIKTSIHHRDADVNQLIQTLVQRLAHAAVKIHERLEQFGTVRQRLLQVQRFAAQLLVVDLLYFRGSVFRLDVSDARHASPPNLLRIIDASRHVNAQPC